jgi:hypothetical protein
MPAVTRARRAYDRRSVVMDVEQEVVPRSANNLRSRSETPPPVVPALDVELLVYLESTLRDLRQNFDEDNPHGGFNIVFTGDFRQLEPIGQDTIFEDECFRQWNDFINCYMGRCLSRFRQGRPSPEDFDMINQRVIINGETLDTEACDEDINPSFRK